MRPAWVFIAFLVACGGGSGPGRAVEQPVGGGGGGELADEDRYVPTYGKPELQRALIAERGAEATGEKTVHELEELAVGSSASGATTDRLRVALADLAVRRRFIAMLEACEARGRYCPPRLDEPTWRYDYAEDDEPKLDVALRFDVDSWRTVAGELHGRACACRTLGCIDSMEVAIHVLEKRPMPAVQGDDAASLSITRARECLTRLRGRQRVRIQSD